MMEVISTRRYEARPPSASTHPGVLIDPESSVALVKEEEWETRKKKEITTTRQIETRVKRQVVLEDGEVVVDSGPLVTTNTTEDVEQQEHTTQERRTTGEKPQEVEWPMNGKGNGKDKGCGPVEGGSVVQKELNETVVRSREEIEERLETEDRHQLGDISDEAYQSAVKKNRGDLRLALAESQKQLLSSQQTGPRVIQHTTRSNKVIDTEKTLERKELKADGLIVTERKCTVEHEEINDDELPDDGKSVEEEEREDAEERKESSQRFVKKRDEDVVDYVLGGERVGREMRYVAETTEGERIGDWSPSASAMRTSRLHKHTGLAADNSAAARKDALTKKPLDLEEEDEARKFETSKWLESHFGSESRSSHGSIDADDSPLPPASNTSYINVTMRSVPPKDREYHNLNSIKQKQRTGPTSTSPSGYFHGISEWSERYQGREKQKNHVRSASPSHSQPLETQYTNGHSHGHRNQLESTYSRTYESLQQRDHQESAQDRVRTPSPPVRRRLREQWARTEEKTLDSTPLRTSSPVHVLQQTWESRSREAHRERGTSQQINRKKSTSISRSPSPSPSPRPEPTSRDNKKPNETPNSRPQKSSGHSKYKIGESFRKLVDKLRSASTERKNKRASSSSASQLTQTDDNGPTYLQYNVIDRNIPLVNERDLTITDEKPPERPPRSPRHPSTANKSGKSVKSSEYVVEMQEQCQRSVSTPPLQRYYLGEDPFGGSIYGREKGYRERGARRVVSKPRRDSRIPGETEYSPVSSSLGRFSKSTSRLASDYEREEHFRTTQTLPRNLHSSDHSRNTNTRPSSHLHHSALRRHHQHQHHYHQQQQQQLMHQASHSSKHGSAQQISIGAIGGTQSRQYGSMINISIKNTVSAGKTSQNNLYPPPPKPERTYKSSLARSKSFNVEAEGRNNSDTPPRIPYTSNLQLNRLGETTPLKSPGILASLSRSNRDLLKDRNEITEH